jgi:hypothetical protein
MSQRLQQVLVMNPDFAKAYSRGEKWAVDRAEGILGIDGLANRRFPERTRDEDRYGTPKNHCVSCPYKSGCVTCDLPYNPQMSDMIGTLDD